MRIENGLVFGADRKFHDRSLFVSGDKIADQADGDVLDAGGCYVIPGLVDVHTHGAVSGDWSDGIPDDMQAMSRWYAQNGTTSLLATTMTLQEPVLLRAMESIRDFSPPEDGAAIAGVHLEGPFLSFAKRGAQNPDNLHTPDFLLLQRLDAASGGLVRVVTVAPEEPEALAFIAAASRNYCISLGHSAANYQQAAAGFAAGACRLTHLFNGMPPLHHREPGMIGAAFDRRAWAEVICDGLHIHESAIRCAFRLFGDRTVLVSDSLRCAGMPDGSYALGGLPIRMENGKATLPDGTLAGSSFSLLEALRRAVSFGIPLEDAIYAATVAPAASACLPCGTLEPGRTADILLLDNQLQLRQVILRGKPILPRI